MWWDVFWFFLVFFFDFEHFQKWILLIKSQKVVSIPWESILLIGEICVVLVDFNVLDDFFEQRQWFLNDVFVHLQRSYVLAELDLFFLFIDARFDILLLLLLSLSLFSGLQYILSVLICDLALFVLSLESTRPTKKCFNISIHITRRINAKISSGLGVRHPGTRAIWNGRSTYLAFCCWDSICYLRRLISCLNLLFGLVWVD